jgi:hypothetical protein
MLRYTLHAALWLAGLAAQAEASRDPNRSNEALRGSHLFVGIPKPTLALPSKVKEVGANLETARQTIDSYMKLLIEVIAQGHRN